jgi:hypothetical protein
MSRRTPSPVRDDGAIHEEHLALGSLSELFGAPVLDDWGGTGHLASGVERLLHRLEGSVRAGRLRVVLEVPRAEVTDGTEERVRAAIVRYCAIRSEELHDSRAAQRRDGIGALRIGVPVLLTCLVVAEIIRATRAASWVQSFFADGLLLVLAWVAIWYPLDMIFYYGRPLNRAREVTQMLGDAEIVVRAGEVGDA